MKKIEQIIKEIQLHIDNEEFNEMIAEKVWDVWRYTRNKESHEWVERQIAYTKNLKRYLSPEEKKKMEDSHVFQVTNDGYEHEECIRCGMDENRISDWPQYCDNLPCEGCGEHDNFHICDCGE